MKRTWNWSVAARNSSIRIVERYQPPWASAPLGPMVSSATHVWPASSDASISMTSSKAFGPVPPPVLSNQRQ